MQSIPEQQDENAELDWRRWAFQWASQQIRNEVQDATWQAFWLTAVEGETAATAADRLKTTKAQVYVARSRVMSLLKRTVEQSQFDSSVDRVDQ